MLTGIGFVPEQLQSSSALKKTEMGEIRHKFLPMFCQTMTAIYAGVLKLSGISANAV